MKDRNDSNLLVDYPIKDDIRKSTNKRHSCRSAKLGEELRIRLYRREYIVDALGKFTAESISLTIVICDRFSQI